MTMQFKLTKWLPIISQRDWSDSTYVVVPPPPSESEPATPENISIFGPTVLLDKDWTHLICICKWQQRSLLWTQPDSALDRLCGTAAQVEKQLALPPSYIEI